jgi:alpha-amylase
VRPSRSATVLTAFVALLAAVLLPSSPAVAAPDGGRTVIAHLFEWKWTDVGRECARTLGPKGYGGVQISPPQEHVVLPADGYPWWQHYQPVSYRLESRMGNRAQLGAMVRTCHAAGVKVYADVVLNHMAGADRSGTGSAGSPFSPYTYPGTYGPQDFHHCGRNGTDDIQNWNDAWEIRNCELVNLSDLDTGAPYVRGRLTAYLDDLMSLGVDGFRVDAAKHVEPSDLAAIFGATARRGYVYQEVFSHPGDVVPTSAYTGVGDVTEFSYGETVSSAFRSGDLASLSTVGTAPGWLPPDRAVVFTDNHDTQRGGSVLTYKDGPLHTLGNVFALAHPYGTPVVMSSYTFTDTDAGPPSDGGGTTRNVTCGSGGWVCEHAQRAVANMVGFRNATAGAGLSDWWTNGGDQVAFGRGSRGYVVVNRGSGALTRTFQTSLPAGTYCDVVHGETRSGRCTGPVATVDSGGRLTATVGSMDALAIHAGALIRRGR